MPASRSYSPWNCRLDESVIEIRVYPDPAPKSPLPVLSATARPKIAFPVCPVVTVVDGDELVAEEPLTASNTSLVSVPVSSTANADAWLFALARLDIVMVIVLSPPLESEFSVANWTLEKLEVAWADPCNVMDWPEQSTLDTDPNADCHAIPTTTDRPDVVPVRVIVNELLPLVIDPRLGPIDIAIAIGYLN